MEEKAKVESGGEYSYGCTLESGEEVIVTRVGDRWAFATTDMTHGATCEDFPNNGRTTRRIFGLSDDALFMVETLVKSIRADQVGAVFGGIAPCHAGCAKTETQMRMDDGSVVAVSRGGKSGMWGITITSPSIGAFGLEPTDEQMRSILRLASHILGNGEDRSALAKRIEALEKENDEIRGENYRLREENEAMLYEHMVRGQGQAFREVKARFKAIYEAARREMDIIGSDPHDNRTLNALDRIKNIACGSVKVEPESK